MENTNKKVSIYKWRPFKEARQFARSLGLKNQKEWRTWVKSEARPHDIPNDPSTIYNNKGWTSWGDWLGTGYVANQGRVYRSFQEARVFVRSLGLQNEDTWRNWIKSGKCPNDIPADPRRVYKNSGWVGLDDWLGTRNRKGRYQSFIEARAFVRMLGLKSTSEWFLWAQSDVRPVDIPVAPHSAYKNMGWSGMGDWLGTNRIANQNIIYRSFEEARALVHTLGLKNRDDWKKWSRSNIRPLDIPANPYGTYENKGWISWGDWLGTKRIANQNRVYRPFKDAHAFVRSLVSGAKLGISGERLA